MAIRTAIWLEPPAASDLDEEYLGHFKLVPRKVISRDDSIVRRIFVRVPAAVARTKSRQEIRSALQTSLSGGCRHTYDCCGCWFHSAYAKPVSRRDFVVNVVSARNV